METPFRASSPLGQFHHVGSVIQNLSMVNQESHSKKTIFSHMMSKRHPTQSNMEPSLFKKFRPNLEQCRKRESCDLTEFSRMDSDEETKTNDLSNCIEQYLQSIQTLYNMVYLNWPKIQTKQFDSTCNKSELSEYQRKDIKEFSQRKLTQQSCSQTPQFQPLQSVSNMFLSPVFRTQNAQDQQEVFKLDQENENPDLKKKITIILLQREATMVKNVSINHPLQTFTLKCFSKHNWITSIDQIEKHQWCPKCESFMDRVRDFCKINGGTCTSKISLSNLTYQCCHEHSWNVSHKNWNKKWCLTCSNIKKQELKKQIQEQEKKIMFENQQKQQKLFEEARQRAAFNGFQQKQTSQQFEECESSYHDQVEKKSQEFIQKNNIDQENIKQSIRKIYKILILPEQILKQHMFSQTKDKLKIDYKKLILAIHPDKISHPDAAEAFKKLNIIYTEALSKVN